MGASGSKLPPPLPRLYQKQHRCLANVTLPHASRLGGLFPPTTSIALVPSLPPHPMARWGDSGTCLRVGGHKAGGTKAGTSIGDAPRCGPHTAHCLLRHRY